MSETDDEICTCLDRYMHIKDKACERIRELERQLAEARGTIKELTEDCPCEIIADERKKYEDQIADLKRRCEKLEKKHTCSCEVRYGQHPVNCPCVYCRKSDPKSKE